MLVFKAWRKSPALTQETTPSQRRITRILSDAQQAAAEEFSTQLSFVADALSRGQVERVVSVLPTEPWLKAQEELAAELLGELLDAGSRVTLPSIEKATLSYSFDRERPESSQWARQAAGTMISQITGEQRNVVREVVSSAALGAGDWGDVARRVQGSIGLTTQQAGWVANHYDRAYLTAIRGGMNATQAAARASDSANRYQTAVHRYRANTIARTETMRAASEGRMQAWNQGITEGFIGANWQKEWIPESDACEICLGLRGKKIRVKDSFSVGEPPAHPNCRCDVILVPPKVQPAGAGVDWGTVLTGISTLDDLATLGQIGRYTIGQLDEWRRAYEIASESGDRRSFKEWFEDVVEPDVTVYADEGDGLPIEEIPDQIFDFSIEDMADLEKLYDDTFFTQEQKEAIWNYQDDGWNQINAWLRSGQLTGNSRSIEILDSIFAMAPQWGATGWPLKSGGFSYYRYVDEEVLAGLKVGDRYVDNAYMYTSIDPDLASEYGRMDVALAGMRIIDNGSAPKISLSALTGFTGPLGDPEVIFYRGTPLTFLGKDKYGFYVFRAGAPDAPPRVPEWMDVTPPYSPDKDFKEMGSKYPLGYFTTSIYMPQRYVDPEAYDALEYYRGEGYRDINAYMRDELEDALGLYGSDPYDDDPEPEWENWFKAEDSALAMSDLFKRIPGLWEGIRVWRGIENIDYIDDLTPGTTFLHQSFMSTSLERETALGFGSVYSSDYVLLRINAPKGTKAIIMPVTFEKEVLFPAGTVLKIIKTVKETHRVGYDRQPKLITVVYAEIVPT